MGLLCDNGCEVLFTKSHVKVTKNFNLIFTGERSTSGDGLWNVSLPPQISTIKNITETYKIIKYFPIQIPGQTTSPITQCCYQ